MPGRLLRCVICIAALARFQPAAHAQTTALTGTIEGRVLDRAGAALSGAAIQLTSDALMLPRHTSVDADGSYRLGALPPGLYTVSFTAPNFRPSSRSGVRVGLGETVTVNAKLDVAVNENITVTAELLALDRRATMLKTLFDAIHLEQVPGSRTPDAILSMTPSVQQIRFDVGGSAAMTPTAFSAYGIAGNNRPTLEGMSLSGMNGFGVGLDYGSFEQVSVGAAAYGPEWPAPGVHIQFITKSGGNQYRGAFYAGYESGRWQAHNIDEDQVARGAGSSANVAAQDANRLLEYHDVNADVGGFLRQNRLWWYASLRSQGSSAYQILFAPEPLSNALTAGAGKATLRIGEISRAIFFIHASENRQPIRLDSFLHPTTALNESVESTSDRRSESLVWKVEWNTVVANKIFIEARAGRFTAQSNDRPNGALPRVEDVVDPLVVGGNRDWYQSLHNTQVSLSLGYLLERWGGRHHLTAGADLQSRIDTEAWNIAYPGDVLHVLRNGAPWEVYLFQAPSRSENGQQWYAGWADDSWQLGSRLTLNLGVRVDHFRAFLPEQSHPAGRFNPTARSFAAIENVAEWTVAAPRIAASLDVRGNGRTLLKGSYGRYWLPPSTDLASNVNPNAPLWWERYKWSDTDGDGAWKPGEQSVLVERRGGETSTTIDPDLKLAFVREATARLEQEVAGGFGIQTGFVWRAERQQGARQRASWPFDAFTVGKTIDDPGPDGTTGTADDGAPIVVYDLPLELLGPSEIIVRNGPYGDSDYFTWEAVAQHSLGRRWSVFGAFSHTWHHDQAAGYLAQLVRANEFPATPNDLINTDDGGRHVFTTWTAKAYASYDGPWGIVFAPALRHQSGQAFGRTVVAPLAYGSVRVLVEPVGTRRQDHVTVVDLRVSKSFELPGSRAVTAFVEIFNLLNSNTEELVSWSTKDFLRPIAITPPRIARVGIRIAW